MIRKNEYRYLYLAQFISSLLVVLIHCGTVTDISGLHFMIKSILCRIAVPFFLVNNAFFYRARSVEEKKLWLKKVIKIYLIWSIIYLPLGIQFMNEQINLPLILYPIAFILGLTYTGIFYHLWYFPALLFSLFVVSKLIKRFGYMKSFILFGSLYIVGAAETYSSFITHPLLSRILDTYFSIFLTTRNGLFYSSIFVLIGFFISDKKEFLLANRKKMFIGLFFTFVLLCIEGRLIYLNQGRDKNFLMFLIPLLFFGFPLLFSVYKRSRFGQLGRYSQAIFFIHLIPIEIFNHSFENADAITPSYGIIRFLLGVFVSVFLLYLFEKVKPFFYGTIEN